MTTALSALLAASALYTAPVAGTADPLALPPAAPKGTTVKVTANVKSAPLMTDAAPKKGRKAAAPSSVVGSVKGDAPRVREEGENMGTLPVTLVPGTYNAVRFMAAWRHATNRSEQVTALSGYKGFDFKRSFSDQEIEAKFHVKRETVGITPGLDRTTVRSAQQTAQGFVAGLPHPEIRLLQDLLGQERNVVATMSEHQKVAQDESKSSAERAAARNAIAQGTALMRVIREELVAMGAGDVVDVPAFDRKG